MGFSLKVTFHAQIPSDIPGKHDIPHYPVSSLGESKSGTAEVQEVRKVQEQQE